MYIFIKKNKYWIAVFVAFLIALLIATVYYRQIEVFSMSLNIQKNKPKKTEKNSVELELKKQYQTRTQDDSPAIKYRKIETSNLPINSSEININKFYDYPNGGGSLLVWDKTLVVIDRMGGFYKVEKNKVKKIVLPQLPNRILEYISTAEASLDSNSMRVISGTFDRKRGRLFVGYTKFFNKDKNVFAIAFLDIDNNFKTKGNWTDVYISEPISNIERSHGGGGKLFYFENKVYFSMGYPDIIGYGLDKNRNELPNTQNKKTSFGKIYVLDVENFTTKLVSIGHRNPQGLTVLEDGSLFEVEHGPQGGDEINLIKQGRNYGWPCRTFGLVYGSYSYPSGISACQNSGFTEPVFSFVPSVGISSIHAVRNFNERWDNDFLIGSLKAQSLYRVRLGKSANVIFSEPIWLGYRIRDINQIGNKIITLSDDGKVNFLTVDLIALKTNKKNSDDLHLDPILSKCISCHSFQETTPNSSAPSLANIIDRKIGGGSFNKYSESIQLKEGVWNQKNIHDFIMSPQSFIPGTSMPNLGLSEDEANRIVELIAH